MLTSQKGIKSVHWSFKSYLNISYTFLSLVTLSYEIRTEPI